MEYFFLFAGQLVILFFISRNVTNHLFHFLCIFTQNDRLIFFLVALLYLPGTIIHEISHFFMALILFLRVRDVSIFPAVEKNSLKLGSVTYEKKDFIRGFLVGIAPLGGGIAVFYLISFFHFFPSSSLFLNVLYIYNIFALSSTMFSSKQDMVDCIYIIPLFIMIAGLIYIFNINIGHIIVKTLLSDHVIAFMKTINTYLLLSFIINIGTLLFLTIAIKILKR